jgi:WD40 repeat protein
LTKTIRLWDAVTGAVLQIFEGYLGDIYLVAFLPDGKHVVSRLYNNTVRLWDAATEAAL